MYESLVELDRQSELLEFGITEINKEISTSLTDFKVNVSINKLIGNNAFINTKEFEL